MAAVDTMAAQNNHCSEIFHNAGIIVSVECPVSYFSSYFGHLEGCGAELHQEIRESYYQLLLFLVNAVKGFSSLNDKYGQLCTSKHAWLSL